MDNPEGSKADHPDISLTESETRPLFQGPESGLQRFNMDIESIHFYQKESSTCCAILFGVTFMLGVGNKLLRASLPLSIQPIGEESDTAQSLDITEYYPEYEENVEIGQRKKDSDTNWTPNVSVSASETAVRFSGVGVRGTTLGNMSYFISLVASRLPPRDNQPRIQWVFQDPEGVYFPSKVRLLFVVSKKPCTAETWFPFKLHVGPVQIDIQRKSVWLRRISSGGSKTRASQISIRGRYRPELAAEALLDIQQAAANSRVPNMVGLRAAVAGYIPGKTHIKRADEMPGQSFAEVIEPSRSE